MTITRLRTAFLLAATAATGAAACGSPTTIDDHFDVDGFELFEGTTSIYRYMLDDGQEPPLTLTEGLHDVTFVLLGPDGEPIPEEEDAEHEEEHELQILIGDVSVLTWTPEPHGAEPAHGFIEFHGELDALQAGSTDLQLCVPHDDTHCDFEAAVPVTVTTAQ